MRLWSIHPKYLDRKGLLALWREALLAQKVLLNQTKGYRNHPQLIRFKCHKKPIAAIGRYLYDIYQEGKKRKYKFSKDKIICVRKKTAKIKVTQGQVNFEFRHLFIKLKKRDIIAFRKLLKAKKIKVHPLFILTKGARESWERYE